MSIMDHLGSTQHQMLWYIESLTILIHAQNVSNIFLAKTLFQNIKGPFGLSLLLLKLKTEN